MLPQGRQFCKDPAEVTEMLVETVGTALGASKASAGRELGNPTGPPREAGALLIHEVISSC